MINNFFFSKSNDSHLTITDIANEIEFLTSNKLTKNNNSESIRYKEVKITRTINQVKNISILNLQKK